MHNDDGKHSGVLGFEHDTTRLQVHSRLTQLKMRPQQYPVDDIMTYPLQKMFHQLYINVGPTLRALAQHRDIVGISMDFYPRSF